MLPNINPKLLKQAMKKMGMKQEDILATEIIIKTEDKDLIITNPQVSKVDVMGQTTYQISGDVQEVESKDYTEEDIKTVASQAGVSKKEAEKALEETDGDLAEAILKLKK